MVAIAKGCGYLKNLPDFISLEDLNYIPRDKTLIIATGSQGESRAAMARIARGDHEVKLTMGDTAIFSARAIPGNEAEINRVKNNLVAGGVKLISPDDTKHLIHVSGHPRRDEISDMLQWLRPECVVPVHGERLMLESHASLAKQLQVPHTFVPTNGAVIRLGPDRPDFVDHIETGVLVVEPNRIMSSDHRAISERRKLQLTGAVHISVALNIQGELLARPKITTTGLIDETDEDEAAFLQGMSEEVAEILKDVPWEDREDDHIVSEDLRIGIRRYVSHFLGIKPKTSVHVLRV
jgi:ribonuclease J